MEADPHVAAFFGGKPVQQALFRHVHETIGALGVVKIRVTKSQVAFVRGRQFAWVWFPPPWDKTCPPNSLVLSFALGTQVTNPRIVQVVEAYPSRWMHHVIIEKETDVDEVVRGWLREAYEFGVKHIQQQKKE